MTENSDSNSRTIIDEIKKELKTKKKSKLLAVAAAAAAGSAATIALSLETHTAKPISNTTAAAVAAPDLDITLNGTSAAFVLSPMRKSPTKANSNEV